MRRWLLLLMLVVCAAPVASQAQATPWAAWLYNPVGAMTYVSSDGIVRDLPLPTVAGQEYPQEVAVSPAGDRVAYMTSNPQLNAHRLVLYNLTTETTAADAILTDLFANSLSFNASPDIYNETGTALALGLAPMDGIWRLLILNAHNGTTMAELRADDPPAADAGLPVGAGVVPVVRFYHDNQVAFDLKATAETDETLGSYFWRPIQNEISTNAIYPTENAALLATTGEVVTATHTPSLPALAAGAANALYAFDPATGAAATFFNDPALALARPYFIQNGERVLVNGLAGDGTTGWTVVERGGMVAGTASFRAVDIFGLADGFMYLTPDDARVLMLANTRDSVDAGRPVGMAPAGVPMQLAWAGNTAAVPPSDYGFWFNLFDSVSVAQATQAALGVTAEPDIPVEVAPTVEPTADFFVAPTPSFLPTPAAFTTQLQVGDRAVVTSAGHAAGLRTEPDDQAPAIILLYTDMLADVLEGPEITDGYIWWRIQTVGETPRIGWAVEGAQGRAWLVPVGQ